jgi:hypothetical protein
MRYSLGGSAQNLQVILNEKCYINMCSIHDDYLITDFFLIGIVGGWSPIGSTWHCGHQWPIVPALGDYDDGEIGGMIDRGNQNTWRKPVPVPLCPP